ncbi:hypothetical protein BR10RB9215_C10001 [Brucella sp. 10RB9215]|nr:hypothetical protein BR10RB9215_C10001 [Brucella sp. 10RB9215]
MPQDRIENAFNAAHLHGTGFLKRRFISVTERMVYEAIADYLQLPYTEEILLRVFLFPVKISVLPISGR